MLRDALVLLTFWCCAGAASGAPIADQPQPELQYRQTIVAPAADRTHLAGNTLAVGGLADGGGACTNPIACENLLPGAAPTEWNIAEPGDSSILGLATPTSVGIRDTVRFKIKSSALAYHIDIFRAGWYQGNGARKVASGIIPFAQLP